VINLHNRLRRVLMAVLETSRGIRQLTDAIPLPVTAARHFTPLRVFGVKAHGGRRPGQYRVAVAAWAPDGITCLAAGAPEPVP